MFRFFSYKAYQMDKIVKNRKKSFSFFYGQIVDKSLTIL